MTRGARVKPFLLVVLLAGGSHTGEEKTPARSKGGKAGEAADQDYALSEALNLLKGLAILRPHGA